MQIQNIQFTNVSQSTGIKPALDGDDFTRLLAALMGNVENIEATEAIEILENLESQDEQIELPFPVAIPFNLMNFQNQNVEASMEVNSIQPELVEPVQTELKTQTLDLDEEAQEAITNLVFKEEIAPKKVIAPKEEVKVPFEQKLQATDEKIDKAPLELKPQPDEKSLPLNEVEISKEEKVESFKAELFNLQQETKEVQNIEPKVQAKPIEPAVAKENIQRLNDSIIKLIETTTLDNKNVMKVKLYPEELGTLDLTLEMEEGKLVAKIIVDNESVKQLFDHKLGELNQNLIKQNVNVQDFKVEVKPEASLDFNFQGEFSQDNREQAKGNRIFGHKEIIQEETPIETTSKSGELNILA